ncbi:hypothetical protein [Aliiglaciecola lipolytica]|uniref:hypothetical protein n=1 Tax=Aliiglaciecola lipolytica TaxID=477689 RepID=UPI001C08754D|nr:hypothetical protein [Aliiglaciecola lipolytica]MBU2878001.1 hypothetical protein [Aliiglaciecola lipolytica]
MIFRKLAKPTDVFSLSYAKVKDQLGLPLQDKEFQELRVLAEKKAKKESISKEVTLEEIYDFLPFSKSIKQTLLESELTTESDFSFLYQPMLTLAESLVDRDIQVLFLSDMYLSKAQIREMFFKSSTFSKAVPLYVSSEYRANKATGQLFKIVKEDLTTEYDSWLHIGDHAISDVRSPKSIGLHSIHASPQLNIVDIFKTEQSLFLKNPKFNAVRRLASMHFDNSFESSKERSAFEVGAFVWAPGLFSFADWVIDKTLEVESTTILCLMREAEVYVPLIAKRLEQRGIIGISVQRLYASRKSTFWPSIDSDSEHWIDDVLELLVARRGYSVDDFYRDFFIPVDELHATFQTSYVKHADSLFYKGENLLKVLRTLAYKNAKHVKNYINEQKARFVRYYDSHISTPYKECVVVDFGNGGTIQNQIQNILGQHCSANLLFYSSERIYRYTKDTLYQNFINADNDMNNFRKLLARSPECIEAFLVGDCGTTLGYSDDKTGTPILEEKLVLNSGITKAFLSGVKQYFQHHYELGFGFIDSSDSIALLLRFIQFPTLEESLLYTKVYHQDNFGSNDKYPVISEHQIDEVKKIGVENSFLEFSRYTKWKATYIHWPQAILNLISNKFMQKQHGLVSMDTDNDVAELFELIVQHEWTSFSVYGAGEFFEKLLPYIKEYSLNVDLVIDRKAEISGSYEFLGYDVVSVDQAVKSKCKNIVVCSMRFKDEIIKNLREQFTKYKCEKFQILSL